MSERTMSEQTEGQIVIEAPAAEVMDVLTDFEATRSGPT
jgi:hypothetical protein